MNTTGDTSLIREAPTTRDKDRKPREDELFIQELADGDDRIATFLMALVFLLCLATPLLVVPIGWFVFFLILMPFDDLLRRVDGSYARVFSDNQATLVNLLQWFLIAALFGYFTRKMRLKFAIPLAYLTIVVVVVLVQWLAPYFGFEFEGIFGMPA